MTRYVFALLVLVGGMHAEARRSAVEAGRESARRVEDLTAKGLRESGVFKASEMRMSLQEDLQFRSDSAEVVEGCVAGCDLPFVVEDIALSGGAKHELSVAAVENARLASARAANLVRSGMSAEAAQVLAFEEQGLDSQAIEKNCR